MYKPKPINVDNTEIPEELLTLTELLAENVHAVWAQERINNGWIYGRQRNDIKKQSPCLIPYDELPEQEKEYDRITVTTTIMAILHLGYKIVENKSFCKTE